MIDCVGCGLSDSTRWRNSQLPGQIARDAFHRGTYLHDVIMILTRLRTLRSGIAKLQVCILTLSPELIDACHSHNVYAPNNEYFCLLRAVIRLSVVQH